MSPDLRTLTLQNIPDAIHVINESSRGTSLEYALDTMGFLWLSRYWNFSYEHSLMLYVQDEPAALAIHCTDPPAHEAYTFYWGALPRFRSPRISLTLAEACATKLHGDGYTTVDGDTIPDRPVRRWRFVHFYPVGGLADMQAESPALPATDPNYEVRRIEIDDLSPLPPAQPVHWCQRHNFLRNAAPFLEFSGAFAGDTLKACMVLQTSSAKPVLLDVRSADPSLAPGYELLRRLVHGHSPPFKAIFVSTESYLHRLLTAASFGATREFFHVRRDLRTSCSIQTGP